MITDRFNHELKVGDEIEYVGVSYNSPQFKKGIILEIDELRKNGDVIKVLGNGKKRYGWTYPSRTLKLHSI